MAGATRSRCWLLLVAMAISFVAPAFAQTQALPGRWQPPQGLRQVPLWPGGAPDMEGVEAREESTFLVRKVPGRHYQAIADVSVPTLTVFPPKGGNSGTAILVFPGGGFNLLAIDLEGSEICEWITARGMTCVLLKYRVPKSNHHWDKTCRCHVTPRVPWALQDAQRAIRLVRARATEWRIDPQRIGVMGFSAGGYLVAQTGSIFDSTYAPVDAADGVSSRPDFAIALYPGHLCRNGGEFDPGLPVGKNSSPTFLLQSWEDPVDKVCNSTLYARALDAASVPAEVHLFGQGGHAFGLRENPHAIRQWPALLEAWLRSRNLGRREPPSPAD